MVKTLHLRDFRDDDLVETALLWRDSWVSTGLSSANDPTLDEYRQRLATAGESHWSIRIACRSGEILGFVAFELENTWLRQLFVKPEMKRAGVGAALLRLAKQEMPGGFWLRTNAKNLPARRFYEKNGFLLQDETSHPIWGQIMAAYRWP